jgi:putative membrane protein
MRKEIKQVVIVSVIAGCTAFVASAQVGATNTTDESGYGSTSAASPKADRKTTEFIKDAARDNSKEIAMMEVATQKAQNSELKSYAQKLHQDHMQAYQQIQQLAQAHGVTLEDQSKAKQEREVTKLSKEETGAKWDQNFAENALKDHANDIQKYEEASNQVKADDVKQFVQAQIPQLQQHFQEAQSVARNVGVSESTIASYAKRVSTAVGGTGEDKNTSTGSGTGASQSTNTHKWDATQQGEGAAHLKRNQP